MSNFSDRMRDELVSSADALNSMIGDPEAKFVGSRVFSMLRDEDMTPEHIEDCMEDLKANAQTIIDIINKPPNVEEKLDAATEES